MPIRDQKKRLPPPGQPRQITRAEWLECRKVSEYVQLKSQIDCDLAGNPVILSKSGRPLPVSPFVAEKLAFALRAYWSKGCVRA